MRIAMPVLGKDLSSKIDPRFGRAANYLVVDSEKKEDYQLVPNLAASSAHGAGVGAAQIIANQKAEAVIVSSIGPNAFQALDSANIAVYQTSAVLSAQEAVEKFKTGQLPQISAPTGPSGGPPGRGIGPGRGLGARGHGRGAFGGGRRGPSI